MKANDTPLHVERDCHKMTKRYEDRLATSRRNRGEKINKRRAKRFEGPKALPQTSTALKKKNENIYSEVMQRDDRHDDDDERKTGDTEMWNALNEKWGIAMSLVVVGLHDKDKK